MNYGIDMRKVPIVIYPTLHYQNGGLDIDGDGFSTAIPNLLVAGEAAGGIHGRNRLMGNSLLDVIVFGINAGKKAAAKCKDVELGEMNLNHIYSYAEELKEADLHTDKVSPMLLPNYARHLSSGKKEKELTKMREVEVSRLTDVIEKLCIEANEHFPKMSKTPSKHAVPVRTASLPRVFWTISLKTLTLQIRNVCLSARILEWHVCSWKSDRMCISLAEILPTPSMKVYAGDIQTATFANPL